MRYLDTAKDFPARRVHKAAFRLAGSLMNASCSGKRCRLKLRVISEVFRMVLVFSGIPKRPTVASSTSRPVRARLGLRANALRLAFV